MSAQSDWFNSRERVNADLKRIESAVNDVTATLHCNKEKLSEQQNEQTKELTETINGNHFETLDQIHKSEDRINSKVQRIELEVMALKTKSTIWGAIGGLIVSLFLKWLMK